MRLKDAVWSPLVNWLCIDCDQCKTPFHHRADRWDVKCPICGNKAHLGDLRDQYVKERQAEDRH